MHAWQILHQFGQEFQTDQEGFERIVAQFRAASEYIVEDLLILGNVAAQHLVGEFVLVPEVIEETALGDARFCDHLLERGRGKALRQHAVLRDLQNSLACRSALSALLSVQDLYSRYGFHHGTGRKLTVDDHAERHKPLK
mgnify:CR=1 FL=1